MEMVKDIAQYEETNSELAKYTITKLSGELRASQTNEETYRLEMQEVTKILGLDEHTIFDDVKLKINELQQRIDTAIELLEQENSYCPSSLTLEKSYIIEVEKINKVLKILKGSEE